ncbi:hypothetical protein GCM10010988_40310 [Cnuibacter physcomitrellae]|uniref:Uncharacterized protein n=1 Tax=Cnuibacter physcomitrellae TaxID=1619308 RepID=A0A1X9M000_9MICO|nr:hypothetical protein [Cnuibacter physcomitrellae]ARJ07650.1 hypothetical protein B5808_19935 [Cnuibacter physcomitrellae]GGI42692.1 hypothetical protein GCM10010988_40310 [Cnuibacter physcomitrellae]
MSIPVPSFPVIRSTLRDDATGELVVNDTSYPIAGDTINRTRTGVIAYTASRARELGRPVRLRATEPGGGTFDVAVSGDGYVQTLNPDQSVDEPRPGQTRLVEQGKCRTCGGETDVSENYCAFCGTKDPLSAIVTPGEHA